MCSSARAATVPPMRSSSLLPLPAALAALALVPAAAGAATVATDGAGNYTYTAAPGEKNSLSFQVQDDASTVVFYSYGVQVTAAPATCTVGDDGMDATCTGVKTANVLLGDGDDFFARSGPLSVLATVDGGDGADWLRGDYGNDVFSGGPGKDKIEGNKGNDTIDGGDGDDHIEGSEGSDTLQGGGGNDVITPDYYAEPMADVVDGGPGIDTIESDYAGSALEVPQSLTFTMNGGADDGRPDEHDDLRSIERLSLSISPVLYVGTDGDDYVKVAQATNPGDLRGGLGNDDLNGADGDEKLDGGPGDDHLDGGFGDDVITGGPGKDRISGDLAGGDCGPLWCKLPYGNDIINAQDGEADSIGCGFGTDTVYADAIDTVAGDCETVNRAGATPVPPTTPKTTPSKNGNKGSSLHAALARKVTIAQALKKGLTIKVTGAPAAKKLALSATRSGKVVAKGSGKADKKGTATVTLKFTSKAKKALRKAKTLKLKVSGGGATATVTLKRR
jgi:hypothetical protein